MSDHASVCVLSYQRPEFLDQTISSLLVNAAAPLELIVHDDGSTNRDVRQVIENYQSQGLISTVILNAPGHNEGVGRAMNRAFALATGDPIIKADQDLVYQPGWLARVVELLNSNQEIGLLSGFRYWHDPCDWRKTIISERDGWDEHEIIMGSFMAVRRACWEELGPWDEYSDAFAEDNVFQKRVTASEAWVCGTPQVDLMQNIGYGVGPSTVVPAEGQVAAIHHGPYVLQPRTGTEG